MADLDTITPQPVGGAPINVGGRVIAGVIIGLFTAGCFDFPGLLGLLGGGLIGGATGQKAIIVTAKLKNGQEYILKTTGPGLSQIQNAAKMTGIQPADQIVALRTQDRPKFTKAQLAVALGIAGLVGFGVYGHLARSTSTTGGIKWTQADEREHQATTRILEAHKDCEYKISRVEDGRVIVECEDGRVYSTKL